MIAVNSNVAKELKANLEPCLVLVWYIGENGNSRYLQMVSWNVDLECWQDLYNLKPLNNGEKILYWTPLKWLERNYQHWVIETN